MGAVVCWCCIEDKYLKKIIRKQGGHGTCTVCGKKRKRTFSAEDLAELLDPVLKEHFAQGPEVKRFGADDEEWWEQEGDPLSHHLQEVIGQYLGFEDEIIDALVENEGVRPQDGEEPFFDRTQDYVSIPSRPYRYYEAWNFAVEDLKHRRRFFNSAAADLFRELFDGVEIRQWWNTEKRASEKVIWELPEGSKLFRARFCGSTTFTKEAYKEPFKYVGPPPAAQARAGRMNVEGVAMFYGAMDFETCLAEIRPALGSETAVIMLSTTKQLRVLDFTRLGESYRSLSYFQPDFREECEKGAFLGSLQNLISQPIAPGRESDYLITQTMTEYLGHVREAPIDGILFKSVQRSGGINIVIFPDATGVFPLAYVNESFKLYSTRAIEYTHEHLSVGLIDDEIWIDRERDDE